MQPRPSRWPPRWPQQPSRGTGPRLTSPGARRGGRPPLLHGRRRLGRHNLSGHTPHQLPRCPPSALRQAPPPWPPSWPLWALGWGLPHASGPPPRGRLWQLWPPPGASQQPSTPRPWRTQHSVSRAGRRRMGPRWAPWTSAREFWSLPASCRLARSCSKSRRHCASPQRTPRPTPWSGPWCRTGTTWSPWPCGPWPRGSARTAASLPTCRPSRTSTAPSSGPTSAGWNC
mmetsp:Transcript_35068/g.62682  ORF Transcript_35068/g.62682 Transcript_35068/m.62682 type:complete len:229 (+) Transcript_35068:254-940(+)